jgi:hypothetical protein
MNKPLKETSAQNFDLIHQEIEEFIKTLKEEKAYSHATIMTIALIKIKAGKPLSQDEYFSITQFLGELHNQANCAHTPQELDAFEKSLKKAYYD